MNADILGAELATLAAQYKTKPLAPSEAVEHQRDRFAAQWSLAAVLQFIDGNPEWRELDLGFAIRKLIIALGDINDGRPTRWLENHAPNSPPTSVAMNILRGRCAGLVERLRGSGMPLNTAARFVFDRAPDTLKKFIGANSVATVAQWRKDARKTRGPATLKDGYHAMLPWDCGDRPLREAAAKALVDLAGSAEGF